MIQVPEATPALEAIGIHKRFGGVVANDDVNLRVEKGRIHALLGENGAGKSTAMKAVFGMLPLRRGSVWMGDRDITHLKPQERVRNGMGFVPQNNNVFTSLTVKENLEMGAFIRRDDFSDTLTQVFDLFQILKEKHKNDPKKLNAAQAELFKAEGVNPLGGCLPMLLQMPILIAFFTICLLYTSPSPRDGLLSRMPSSA